MNKKYVSIALVSLLLCTVHNSKMNPNKKIECLENEVKKAKLQSELAKATNKRYLQNNHIAWGIKAATHLAKKSILKDSTMGSVLDNAANINLYIRALPPKNEKRFQCQWPAENVGSYATSVVVVAASNEVSKTRVGKKIKKIFDGRLKPIKELCKYLVEVNSTGHLWRFISKKLSG